MQTLHASVSMLNVKVCDSTIRERQNKYGLFGWFIRRKPLLSKKEHDSKAQSQDFWNNVLWTKEEMFGHNAQYHVW